jgi:lysozyme family protein
MPTLNPALKKEYENLYATMQINATRVDKADSIIDDIVANKEKYKAVEQATGFPWFVIAAIHSLEASLNFNTHLHNGDPLSAKTVHVPAGRPPGNPPFTWPKSAIDALKYRGQPWPEWSDWSVAGTLYYLEAYNGWGYRQYHSEVKSPYLWSFCNHYTKGKYASDGHFDPNLVSQQCGSAVIIKRMEQRGLIPPLGGTTPNLPTVTWLELYRKEEGADVFSAAAGWAGSQLVEAIEFKDRSTEELIAWLGKYPTAQTFHIAPSSKTAPSPTVIPPPANLPNLPSLTRILRWGAKGDDVKALQNTLNRLSLNAGAEDGDFGDQTETAVKAFQVSQRLQVDGEVGPITWKVLGGKSGDVIDPDSDVHIKLADFASVEAAKGLKWNGASSEAEKYLAPLRPIMQQLNHIGSTPVFYDWCGAFVTYCCRQVGITIPDKPDGFWASMALVASWEYWAKQQGYWYPGGTSKPEKGDIVTFDWSTTPGKFNHIGIVRGYTPGSSMFNTAEGNVNNQSAHKSRPLSAISGLIRIR